MSQENVEIVREMQQAFNRGDYAAALSALADDVEWHAPSGLSLGEGNEVYHGRDQVVKEFARWLEAWETYRFEPTEVLDHGDHVFVAGIQTARGHGSGAEARLPTFHVYTLRDGKVTLMRSFDDRATALKAAGLSE